MTESNMLTERYFDTGTLTINYAEGPANGSPLVLLHGGTARWQELNPLITELEQHWHVHACDQRGHGKSDRAASYRVVDFFPDTTAFIKDYIGAPTVLLGHSGGAIVALGVAAQIPELIRAVILLDPPLFLRELSIKSNWVYDYFLGSYNILTHQRTANEVFSELFPNIDEAGIQHLEEVIRLVDPEFVKVLLEDRYFADLDTQNLLEKVTCPTLMLYGQIEKGAVVRDKDVEFFLAHTSNGSATQVKDAGHLLQWDQPVQVLELIKEFVEKL
jgi:pimeloyl-ACP methyl ester carboxylesterase